MQSLFLVLLLWITFNVDFKESSINLSATCKQVVVVWKPSYDLSFNGKQNTFSWFKNNIFELENCSSSVSNGFLAGCSLPRPRTLTNTYCERRWLHPRVPTGAPMTQNCLPTSRLFFPEENTELKCSQICELLINLLRFSAGKQDALHALWTATLLKKKKKKKIWSSSAKHFGLRVNHFHCNKLLGEFINMVARCVYWLLCVSLTHLEVDLPVHSALRNHVVLYCIFITSVCLPAAF